MLKQLNDDKLKQLNDDKSSLASHREAILMANKRYCAAAWDLSKQRDKDRENSDRRGFEGVCGGAAIDAVVSTFDTSILNDWDNLTINNRKHAVEVVQWWGLFMPDSSCGLVDRVCEHAIRGCKPPPEEEELPPPPLPAAAEATISPLRCFFAAGSSSGGGGASGGRSSAKR